MYRALKYRMKIKAIMALLALMALASAWGNGYAVHPDDEIFTDAPMTWQRTYMYGTQDYLAEKAWKMLAEVAPEEAEWISQREFFYGTELPDSRGYDESINDQLAQYLVFDEEGRLLDNKLANRAMNKYDEAVAALDRGAYGTASKWSGTVLSYIAEAGLFSKVMDDSTNGYPFQQHIQWLTKIVYPSDSFEEKYGKYVEYDGALEIISPYDATVRLGQATYLGMKGGSCSAGWMEENYDIEDPDFNACAGRNFNNIVNAQADVLHTIYQAGINGVEYEEHAYDWDKLPIDEPAEEPEETVEIDKEPTCGELEGVECELYEVCLGNVVETSDTEYCCLGICGSNQPPEAETGTAAEVKIKEEPAEEDTIVFYLLAIVLIIAVVALTLMDSKKSKPKDYSAKKYAKKKSVKKEAKKKKKK